MKAYCWASGLIEFGPRVPDGALLIASGKEKPLRAFLESVARHGYETREVNGRPTKVRGTEHLLVPGIPEAGAPIAQHKTKGAALAAFLAWISKRPPVGVKVAGAAPLAEQKDAA